MEDMCMSVESPVMEHVLDLVYEDNCLGKMCN